MKSRKRLQYKRSITDVDAQIELVRKTREKIPSNGLICIHNGNEIKDILLAIEQTLIAAKFYSRVKNQAHT